MQVTFYGHACFSVVVNGKNLLFDPFITPNPLAKHININDIEADYIFLSHGHGDHVADAAAIAKSTNAVIISNYEVASWFEKQGIKCIGMNTGGEYSGEFGTVKCVNAIHSSSLPDGSYGGNPMGFIFKTDDENFYYSGDTALTLDMQLIPMFAKIDFAILPIGDNFTMGYKDAAEAAKMVQCNTVIGVHYDTFEPIEIKDKAQVVNYFQTKQLTLLLPAIGDTINV